MRPKHGKKVDISCYEKALQFSQQFKGMLSVYQNPNFNSLFLSGDNNYSNSMVIVPERFKISPLCEIHFNRYIKYF